MKLSTKILTGLLFLILTMLVFSNFILKRKYDQIDKTDLYWNFTRVLEEPFKYVKIENGNITNIVFEPNPKSSVRISDNWSGFERGIVKASVRRDTLYLLFDSSSGENYAIQAWMKREVLVRIFSPELRSVEGHNTNINLFKLNQKDLTIDLSGKSALEVETYSSYFNKLNIKESDSSGVFFEMSPDVKSLGTIQVDTVNADVKNLSWLGLGHAQIKSLHTNIEDSAAIELSGGTLKSIKKLN